MNSETVPTLEWSKPLIALRPPASSTLGSTPTNPNRASKTIASSGSTGVFLFLLLFFIAGVGSLPAATKNDQAARHADVRSPIVKDLSNVRGFDYDTSSSLDYTDQWTNYKPAEVERDLDYAARLKLNEVRVFMSYHAWLNNRAAYRKNLIHFVRAAHERGIGVMPVLVDDPGHMMNDLFDPSSRPLLREWAQDLVAAIGKEPGLAFWDAANEPDIVQEPKDFMQHRMEIARYMAGVLRELDPRTPVTVGCAFLPCTEELADAVDVLSFHDYSQTRKEIRDNIHAAKAFAEKVGKPVFATELACIARANPYDVALQEFQEEHIGWYFWELMMAHYWGDVHGVFYPDGRVRDPSIPAAILGFFRNRGPDDLVENPDREGWVTHAVTDGRKWLDDPSPDWNKGLDIAETEANLLEAAQLIAMRDPPTRTVDLLRAGEPDIPALQVAIRKYIAILKPYQKAH